MRDEELKQIEDLEKLFDKKIKEIEEQPHTDSFMEMWKTAHDVFMTKTGKRLMELLSGYLMQPVSSANHSERYACVREGHNEIIRMLLRMQKTNPDHLLKKEVTNGK